MNLNHLFDKRLAETDLMLGETATGELSRPQLTLMMKTMMQDEDGRADFIQTCQPVRKTVSKADPYRFYPDSCNSADLSSSDVRPGIQDRIPDTVDHFPDRTRRLSDLCRIYTR